MALVLQVVYEQLEFHKAHLPNATPLMALIC